MDDLIKTICEALIEEAEAVMKNTERITDTLEFHGPVEAIQSFALNRLDEVEHIQNLTVQLTKIIASQDVAVTKDNV